MWGCMDDAFLRMEKAFESCLRLTKPDLEWFFFQVTEKNLAYDFERKLSLVLNVLKRNLAYSKEQFAQGKPASLEFRSRRDGYEGDEAYSAATFFSFAELVLLLRKNSLAEGVRLKRDLEALDAKIVEHGSPGENRRYLEEIKVTSKAVGRKTETAMKGALSELLFRTRKFDFSEFFLDKDMRLPVRFDRNASANDKLRLNPSRFVILFLDLCGGVPGVSERTMDEIDPTRSFWHPWADRLLSLRQQFLRK